MTVQVDVLGRFPLPAVRVILSGVPKGTAWSLHGRAGEDEWLVATGVGDGFEVVTADPWAPLGVEVSYTARHGAIVEVAGPVTRPHRDRSAITDLSGRTVAEVLWTKDGGDNREGDRRAHFSQVAGARVAPARLDPVAGAGGGSVVVRAVQPHTTTLRRLLDSNRPLVLLHNEAVCEIPGCDVAPVRTLYVTGDRNNLTAREDRSQREWSLSYRLMPSGVRGAVVPVVTLGDLKAAFPTLADLKASGLTLGQLKRGDWSVSGLLPTLRRGEWMRGGGGDLTTTTAGEWVDGPTGTLVPSAEPGLYVIEGAP